MLIFIKPVFLNTMKEEMKKNAFTVVDLFAGAGGLSEGFRRKGFTIVSSVEMDPYACETLKTRHAYWEYKQKQKSGIYWDYVKKEITREEFLRDFPENAVINVEISSSTINKVSQKIEDRMKQIGVSSIDVFIGGPPCQAYSIVGRARDPNRMKDDPRKVLYKYYVQMLKRFTPNVFVFENVPGILSADNGELFKEVKEYFINAGYVVEHKILNASDFMVLENRKRVILIGWKKEEKFSYPVFRRRMHSYHVRDIFVDLPSLEPGQGNDISEYSGKTGEYLKAARIKKNGDVLLHHVTRPLNSIDREIYKTAIALWNSEQKRLVYSDLPQRLKTHKNQKSFLDRFKVVADNESASHTVVAHISKDGHYYIHPDIKQLRSISVRESARIQSFPDDYYFEGPRTAKLVQIGNAVPPLMAEGIAAKIKEMLK